MVSEKIAQAISILKENNIDLWMVVDRESGLHTDPIMDYLTGTGVTWLSFFLYFKTGEKYAIVGNLDVQKVTDLGHFDEVFAYKGSHRETLLNLLQRHDPKQIAIDFSKDSAAADGLTYGNYLNLLGLLDGSDYQNRLLSAEKLIATLRGRKSAEEVRRHKAAIALTEEIFSRVTSFAKPGLSEKEIAAFIRQERLKRGVEAAWEESTCPSVFTGPQTVGAHSEPSDKILERGHIFNIDFGVRVEKYCSDLQRTWYILRSGEKSVPDPVRKGFQTLLEAVNLAFQALKPGARGIDIDRLAREHICAKGYAEYPHALGHQVGRYAHDGGGLLAPDWERYGQLPFAPIEKGQVYTIEPRLNIEGYGVATVEEMVWVGENGAEYISTPQDKLFVIQ